MSAGNTAAPTAAKDPTAVGAPLRGVNDGGSKAPETSSSAAPAGPGTGELNPAGPVPMRRPLAFGSFDQTAADVAHLRSAGCVALGQWTLGQVCQHLAGVVEYSMNVPDHDVPTPDEAARREGFFGVILAPGGPPLNMPLPESARPPADAGDDQVDRLITALRAFDAWPHPQCGVGRCGPVPKDDVRRLHLAHAAHHLAFLLPRGPKREGLAYADEAEMLADIARLRGGYSVGGQWTLPQIAWHLGKALPSPIVGRDAQPDLTEDQTARQHRWEHYIAHGRPPEGFESPADLLPPADADAKAVDDLVARIAGLRAFGESSPFVETPAGVMPIARLRGFILAHGAHHLAHLRPTRRRREHLRYASEQGMIEDVRRLRRGYVHAGKWTLEQVAWHLSAAIPYPFEATSAQPTAQELQRQQFIDQAIATGGPPPGFESPPELLPPAECDASAVDELLRRLEALAAFNAPVVHWGAFGPVPTAKLRGLTLGHGAHHLSFLRPTLAPREGLTLGNEDAAIADIRRLRAGYVQTGGWSLPQVCWHIDQTIRARLAPGPHPADSPEQVAAGGLFERILATGALPLGIPAPQQVSPPQGISDAHDAGDDAIDAAISTLTTLRNHPAPLAPHRIFGTRSDAQARRQNLIHVAHHLSQLIPTSAESSRAS